MFDEVWLAAVIALSGAVLIVLLTVLFRGAQGVRLRNAFSSSSAGTTTGTSAGTGTSPATGRRDIRRDPDATAGLTARGLGYLVGGFAAPRTRSVQGNLERAFRRIDSVDPYEVPRRIGLTLADAGLLDQRQPDPEQAEAPHSWPFGPPPRSTPPPSEDLQ